MSKRQPEVWATKSGASARIVTRSSTGQFAGRALPAQNLNVEVWVTRTGAVIKPTARSANGRFL